MKKELTTLTEKEQFVQMFLNINTNIENIFLINKRLEIVDHEDNHMIFNSTKFIRALNASLIVARRDHYKSCKDFVREYQEQKANLLTKRIKDKYPSYQYFLISGGEVAIFVPQKSETIVIQERIQELTKK